MQIQRLHITFLFLMLAVFCSVRAQKITWAASGNLDNKSNYTKVIGENSQGVFLLKYKNRNLKKGFTIEQFTHQLAFVRRKQIKIPKARLEKITVTPSGLIYFTSNDSEVPGNNTLSAFILDSALNVTSGPVRIQQAPSNGYASYPDFSVEYALNRNILASFFAQPDPASPNTVLNLVTFDTKLSVLTKKQMSIAQEYDKVSIRNTLVDNNGNFYVMYLVTKNRRGDEASNFENHLLCYSVKTDNVQDYIVNNTETFIGDHTLDYDETNNKVMLSGFFGYKSADANHGLFFIGIDAATHTVLHKSFNDIDRTLVARLVGQKFADRGEDLSKFFIRKSVPRSDGGVLLIAERYYVTTENQVYYINGIPQNSSIRIYNYDEILVFSINPDGSLDWSDVVNKKQASGNDGGYYSSILTTATKDKVYLVYNDRLNTTADVLQISYDERGNKEQKILLQSDTYFALIVPVEGRQIAYKSAVTPVLQNKNYTLIKLNY